MSPVTNRSALPTAGLHKDGQGLKERPKSNNDKSLVALQGLPSGYSASQLVDVLNASVINFETGSAVIPADSQTFLQSVAGTMSKAPAGTHIEIGGHTDSTGDPEKNLALSQARADAVRQALIDHGVAPEMLSAKGYGGTQPIASNDTAQGRERNRRIAFSVR